MELKTQVHAEQGKQELIITREFDLPVELLFRGYSDPEIVEQWMGTKVIKLENKSHGSWKIETSDATGKVAFRANGTIHEFVPNQKITRTFEMENANVGIQLEFMTFEPLTPETSKLQIHIIYRAVADRDQMLKFGMGKGLAMAHNRLEEILMKLK